MRLGEFVGYIITMMITTAFLTFLICAFMSILALIFGIASNADSLEFITSHLFFLIAVGIWVLLTIVLTVKLSPEYSESEFSDTFIKVNDVVYDDGRIFANGEEFEKNSIVVTSDVPYNLIIDGTWYKNKGVVGIGLDKYECRKLIITEDTYSSFKDYIELDCGNKDTYKSVGKAVEIIEYNYKHSRISSGTSSDKVTQVSMGEVQELRQDKKVAELQNQISEVKRSESEKDKEIERLKRELELEKDKTDTEDTKVESSEETVLKWVWRMLVTVWVMGLSTYIVIKRGGRSK